MSVQSMLATVRTVVVYGIIIFFAIMAGFAFSSIYNTTSSKTSSSESFVDGDVVAPVTKKRKTIGQKIVSTYRRELGRMPADKELEHYASLYKERGFDEADLVHQLQATPEYHHMVKMQSNWVNADKQSRMNDREVDLFLDSSYRYVFNNPPSSAAREWLRNKYADLGYNCARLEAFLVQLKRIEDEAQKHAAKDGDGDTITVEAQCMAMYERSKEPIIDMLDRRNRQDASCDQRAPPRPAADDDGDDDPTTPLAALNNSSSAIYESSQTYRRPASVPLKKVTRKQRELLQSGVAAVRPPVCLTAQQCSVVGVQDQTALIGTLLSEADQPVRGFGGDDD